MPDPEPLEGADFGVARLDPEGSCVYACDTLCRIVGSPREEILGLGWQQRLPAAFSSSVAGRWAELREGRSVGCVDAWVRSDGRPVAARLEALPELDGGGRLTSVVVTCAREDARPAPAPGATAGDARERLGELESLYRNAPVGLAFVDRDLRYLRVNQAIADMNGVAIEDVIGRTYRDLSPETADAAEPFLRALMARGMPIRNLEVRARPPADPDVEHVYLLSLEPVRTAGGEVIGHVSAVQDVTAMRRAEEVARDRLEQLELLYAEIPVGLCSMDGELRVTRMNDPFARLAGRPAEDQVGATLPELLPTPIGHQLLPQLRYVARSGRPSSDLEIHTRHSHAVEYTWIARTHPLPLRDGLVTGLLTVLQDVTGLADRRREAEAARDRLAEAQHLARLGSWEWNILDDTVWWSSELYSIFGEAPGYVPSPTGVFEHVHPDDRERMREQVERALQEDAPYRISLRILRPDGSERVVFAAAQVVRTHGGVPARLVGTCQDVTLPGDRPKVA
jgi:PAS domain S-box-containing protein